MSLSFTICLLGMTEIVELLGQYDGGRDNLCDQSVDTEESRVSYTFYKSRTAGIWLRAIVGQ